MVELLLRVASPLNFKINITKAHPVSFLFSLLSGETRRLKKSAVVDHSPEIQFISAKNKHIISTYESGSERTD